MSPDKNIHNVSNIRVEYGDDYDWIEVEWSMSNEILMIIKWFNRSNKMVIRIE